METFTTILNNEVVRFIFENKIYIYVRDRQLQFTSKSIGHLQDHSTFYNENVFLYLRSINSKIGMLSEGSILDNNNLLGSMSLYMIHLYIPDEELSKLELIIKEWKKKN